MAAPLNLFLVPLSRAPTRTLGATCLLPHPAAPFRPAWPLPAALWSSPRWLAPPAVPGAVGLTVVGSTIPCRPYRLRVPFAHTRIPPPPPLPLQCLELLDILLTAGSGAPAAPEAVPVAELPEPAPAAGCSAEAVVKALLEAGVLELKG